MHDGMEKSQSIFNRKQFIMVCALAGLLLLGGVLGVSAHSDLQNAEKQFEDTISYVKVDVKFPLGIQRISKRSTTTVAAAFQDVLCLSTDNLFGKVGRVVFCIALQNRFQNDTLWPLGDDLRSRHELDTVLLQLGLIPGTVVAIPGKAVKFPDQNNIKQLLVAVLYHLLELRAIIRLGRDGAVNVVLDDSDVILFGIGRAFTNLAFDGFFALVITGIAGVDHSGHGGHLSFHIIER